MAKERFTTGEVIGALRKVRGIMAAAARLLGCHRHTVENYIARHPTVARAYEEQRQITVDVAEGQLIKKVDAGEWPAIKWTLATLGRDRGYVERREQQVSGPNEGPIEHRITGGVRIFQYDEKTESGT